jgi:hypothetical protein
MASLAGDRTEAIDEGMPSFMAPPTSAMGLGLDESSLCGRVPLTPPKTMSSRIVPEGMGAMRTVPGSRPDPVHSCRPAAMGIAKARP